MQKQSTEITTRQFINFNHIYQIYYDAQSKERCFEGFTPVCNERLSPFFENSVIVEVLGNGGSIPGLDWFGVLSPKFFRKAYGGGVSLSGEKLDTFLAATQKQVVGFNIKTTQKNIIKQGDMWHPGFSELFDKIIKKAGIDYDIRKPSKKLYSLPSGHVVYNNIFSNYVIAKKHIWDDYYQTVLKPCYDVMSDKDNEEIQSLLWRDSGYHKMNPQAVKRSVLKEKLGVPFYPYHTFICERFWTMFLNMRNYTMTHYPHE